jgi:hypothetical protein
VNNVKKLSFRQLPLVVKIAVGVTFLNAWISFEEFFVDRLGLWKYMPFYRVADFWVWDFTVTLVIVTGIWYASRREVSLGK